MSMAIKKTAAFFAGLFLVLTFLPASPARAATAACSTACNMLGTATPGTANASDSLAVELGMKFTTDTPGTVTAIRFYKGSKNTGTHVGHLWTSTGTLLATVTFSGETASGWQQASLATPVTLAANTTYVVSYFAPKGNYSYTNNYFTAAKSVPPLHTPVNAASYKYGSTGGFPTSTNGSINYWVDVNFQTTSTPPSDTTPPTVTSVSPAANTTGVGTATTATATFSEALAPASVNTSTFLLTAPGATSVAGAVTYDTTAHVATFTPTAALTAGTTYTATIKSTVTDVAGNPLGNDYTWSFTTAAVVTPPPPPPPVTGTPILLVTSSANPFTTYYTQILQNEGLNEFQSVDIASLDSTTLNAHQTVLLGDMSLTATQVNLISTWVNAGGNLIAMHPDKQLASLLGLTDASATTSNAYLAMSNANTVTAGITQQSMQFHGSADDYSLNGASTLATLFANANTATSFPAITWKAVGANGGQAAAFTYDLAKSVVLTRQGNPAWAGQDRDGDGLVRSDDMFYGAAAGDNQPDWVDMSKVQVPQADEQQRALSNLINQMQLAKNPLPRFWYLPNGAKAAVIMTGDDHGTDGTTQRFHTYEQESPANCVVANWQCVRATSYMFADTQMTQADATTFTNEGFELGSHVTTNCLAWTPTDLSADFDRDMAAFATAFPTVPSQTTNRTHCVAWSDWDSQAHVESAHGIRLDTNYYFYPEKWIGNRPGLYTGSGLPMRFADTNGATVDEYQAVTQITDEANQVLPYTADVMLDNATGANGYYAVITANEHTDNAQEAGSDEIVASAQAHGAPVVSAAQMLQWLDGRNNSSFDSETWDGNTMQFHVNVATGATNIIQAMVPVHAATGNLTGITQNGTAVPYTVQTIKGIDYAFFAASTNTYSATYAADSAAPTVTAVTPAANATNVATNLPVKATFSETLDAATVNSSTVSLTTAGGVAVSGAVSYDAASHSAVFTPTAQLSPSATYTLTLKGGSAGIKDLAGNALAGSIASPFTTSSIVTDSIFGSTTPLSTTSADTTSNELGVKFRSDIDQYVTGVRFYKGPLNTGTHTGSLWTSSGQKLATGTFTGETVAGWQTLTFASPVAISANTTYVASYYSPNGHYAADYGALATTQGKGTVHTLASGVEGLNGVFWPGASAFPADGSNDMSNYGVDVTVQNVAGPDTTPPAVISTSPVSGATSVATGSPVSATFSETLAASTVSSGTFTVADASGNAVTGTVTYNSTSKAAVFTPTAALAASTTYTAKVKGGTSGVTDAAGNPLASDYSWSFTTAAANQAGTPVNLFGTTAPAASTASSGDTNALELGMKFTSDVAGQVTGVRFYKGTGNNGTHTGSLWSSTGQLLATGTFTNETATGWQTMSFATPVTIAANTVYVVSYFAPVGDYSYTHNGFATSVDAAPLHAPASTAVAGGNGVYHYGSTSAFPTTSASATNYWVDVNFTPGS